MTGASTATVWRSIKLTTVMAQSMKRRIQRRFVSKGCEGRCDADAERGEAFTPISVLCAAIGNRDSLCSLATGIPSGMQTNRRRIQWRRSSSGRALLRNYRKIELYRVRDGHVNRLQMIVSLSLPAARREYP